MDVKLHSSVAVSTVTSQQMGNSDLLCSRDTKKLLQYSAQQIPPIDAREIKPLVQVLRLFFVSVSALKRFSLENFTADGGGTHSLGGI